MKPHYLLLASLLLLPACPTGGGVPGAGGPSGSGGGDVNPNACGDLSDVDIGRKIQAFLDATMRLDAAVTSTASYTRDTCVMIGKDLGMTEGLDGETDVVCNAVAEKIRADLEVGVGAEASLDVKYQPAVCTVNADVAAQATAECEAKAKADVSVTCTGTCSGTCSGACDGNCQGAAAGGTGGGAAAGDCNGQCDGTCQGSCQGECQGSAEVEAEASCKANAEVRANVEAECTEPQLDVNYDAAAVVDASSVERTVNALSKGMPRLLMVHAKLTGPVATAFASWSVASQELASSGADAASALGARAVCVTGQLNAAASALTRIQASMSVSVEASVSVSGAAGGSVQ